METLTAFLADVTCILWASLVAQMVKNWPAGQETWVPFLGWEDALEEGRASPCSILAWRVPWTEESGGPQSMGSQRSRTRPRDARTHSASPASYTWRLRAVAACIPAVCSVKACNTVVFSVFPAFPAVQPSARSVSERFLSPGRHPFSLSSHPHRHPPAPSPTEAPRCCLFLHIRVFWCFM